MTDLKWTPQMSVNVELLDKQHKKLFSILNCLAKPELSSNPSEYAKVLNKLTDYFVLHFKDEKEYMKKYDYPEINEHLQEHKEFVFKISMFSMEYNKKVPTDAMKLFQYVKEWLVEHVMSADIAYSNYIEKNQSLLSSEYK